MGDWWWVMFQERIRAGMAMKILNALQGHPNARQLWGDTVEGHFSELSVEPLKHETCLYCGTHEGQKIIYAVDNRMVFFLAEKMKMQSEG
jgi:hypothetical protein